MKRTVSLAQAGAEEVALPERVQEALAQLVGSAKEGLLALSVGVGLGVLAELMEEEVVGVVGVKGRHDPERTAYIESHIDAVRRAAADGAPMKGYFVWSFLDNFEWSLGYSKRFGIVYVDYPTLERVPKDSFYRYRDLIANGA